MTFFEQQMLLTICTRASVQHMLILLKCVGCYFKAIQHQNSDYYTWAQNTTQRLLQETDYKEIGYLFKNACNHFLNNLIKVVGSDTFHSVLKLQTVLYQVSFLNCSRKRLHLFVLIIRENCRAVIVNVLNYTVALCADRAMYHRITRQVLDFIKCTSFSITFVF